MYSASRHPAQGASTRRRAFALLLALAIHALLVLVLMTLAPSMLPPEVERRLLAFSLTPDPAAKKSESGSKQQKRQGGAAPKAPPRPEPPAGIVVPPPTAPAPQPPLPIISLTKEQFAAADISKLTAPRGERTAGGGGPGGASSGKDSGAAYGPGQGPGGVRLHDAEWYRRPTNAELSFYMPKDAPKVGWGLVACQTIEKYHVENCQVLDESPRGSGLGRAVRQAAWQFLVLPPRINGKPMVGEWVRIRIDYTQIAAQ